MVKRQNPQHKATKTNWELWKFLRALKKMGTGFLKKNPSEFSRTPSSWVPSVCWPRSPRRPRSTPETPQFKRCAENVLSWRKIRVLSSAKRDNKGLYIKVACVNSWFLEVGTGSSNPDGMPNPNSPKDWVIGWGYLWWFGIRQMRARSGELGNLKFFKQLGFHLWHNWPHFQPQVMLLMVKRNPTKRPLIMGECHSSFSGQQRHAGCLDYWPLMEERLLHHMRVIQNDMVQPANDHMLVLL